MSVIPAPIQIAPSSQVLGSDGNWTTFEMRVGTPAQTVNIIPSTLLSESFLISPNACTATDSSDCPDLRGGTFDNSTGSWTPFGSAGGTQTLTNENRLIGDNGDIGDYGYATLGLTPTQGNAVVLNDQVIALVTTTDYYVGLLGLSPDTAQVGSNSKPSFLKTLYEQGRIPSLSYSYTAGAAYSGSAPDLTFGGQDQARFEPNNINFTFSDSLTPPLYLGVQSIAAVTSDGDSTKLLQEPTNFYIDSTVGALFLPDDACQAFVDAFGLQVEDITNLYKLNNSARATNLKNNASVVLELANGLDGGDTVTVTLPYSAFDVEFLKVDSTDPQSFQYFPIRTPSDGKSFTLGRTFLQEAYLSVNYDYGNFSLYQAIHSGQNPTNVVALPAMGGSNTTTTTPDNPTGTAITVVQQSSGLATGAIAGIVIAVVVLIALAIGGFCFRRRRQRRRNESQMHAPPALNPMMHGQDEKKPLPQEPPLEGYFALPTKMGVRDSTLSTSTGTPGELESPHVGPSAASSPRLKHLALMGTVNELDTPTIPPAELPERRFSTRRTSQLSDGASSSHYPQTQTFFAGAPATTSTVSRQSLEDEGHASQRPSVLLADSVKVSAPGQAAVVHHSRNSSQRTAGIVSPQLGSYSPVNTHSPGPSIDSSMTPFRIRDSAEIHDHGDTPAFRREENALPRINSQDALASESSEMQGRITPLAQRQAPTVPESPIDDPSFPTPAGASLGYSSNHGR